MYLRWADGHLCRHSQIGLFSSVNTAQNVLRLDKYWEGEFTQEFWAVTDPLLLEYQSFVPELTGVMDCRCAPS